MKYSNVNTVDKMAIGIYLCITPHFESNALHTAIIT